MAQETQTGALYQPRGVGWGGRWEGGSKGKGYMYTYGWFTLRFDRKQQHSVNQLSFNRKQIIFFKLLMINFINISFHCVSVQSLSHVDSLGPHELQHARPPCPSPTPGVHSNSRPSSR